MSHGGGGADQSGEMKAELRKRLENSVNELGLLSKLLVKGSGSHESIIRVAKSFSASETSIGSCEAALHRADVSLRKIDFLMAQITTSASEIPWIVTYAHALERRGRTGAPSRPQPPPAAVSSDPTATE